MFAGFGPQGNNNYASHSSGNFAQPGLTNAYKPFGYSGEPERKSGSNISIDDIISALQTARDSKFKLENAIATMKASQPKPIDLNRSSTCWIVAHKTFATGKVWQPDTPLISDKKVALFELQQLQRQNPTVEYAIQKLEWAESEVPAKKQQQQFDWNIEEPVSEEEDEDEEPLVGGSTDNENQTADEEKRFVFCKPNTKSKQDFSFPI